IADARSKLSERPGCTGMGIRPKEHLARTRKAFFRECNMTHPLVILRTDIIEMREVLICGKGPENIHIAISVFIFGKYIVIRNNNKLVFIPYAGIFAELVLENTNRRRTAYVVGHQYIDVNPDTFAGLHGGSAAVVC